MEPTTETKAPETIQEPRLNVVLGDDVATVTLKTGKTLTLNPLTLGDISEVEEHFGVDIKQLGEALKNLKHVFFLVHLSVRKNHPELLPKTIGDMFKLKDMKDLNDIVLAILRVSGLHTDEKNEHGTPA